MAKKKKKKAAFGGDTETALLAHCDESGLQGRQPVNLGHSSRVYTTSVHFKFQLQYFFCRNLISLQRSGDKLLFLEISLFVVHVQIQCSEAELRGIVLLSRGRQCLQLA